MEKDKACWFETWFNSEYYHILYRDRNQNEAAGFIDKLLNHLRCPEGSRFWDMACGKGRHALHINEKKFDVTGTDLSEESIHYASRFENEKLRFFRHDMRKPFVSNYFDYVLNLFTSFGYFETGKEELQVFSVVHTALKPGGIFVLDYLNTEKAAAKLRPYEEKEINGILFRISKRTEKGFIIKRIQFTDKGKDFDFHEKVKLLRYEDFLQLAGTVNFKVLDAFGDYTLSNFDAGSSDRLICIFQK